MWPQTVDPRSSQSLAETAAGLKVVAHAVVAGHVVAGSGLWEQTVPGRDSCQSQAVAGLRQGDTWKAGRRQRHG